MPTLNSAAPKRALPTTGLALSQRPPVLLTETDLAHRWQVARGSLANDRSANRGVPFVKLGTRVRYRLSDVEAYEAAALVSPLA